MKEIKLFIDNNDVLSESGKTFTSYCPATGETLARLASASRADVDKAVEAARAAFPSWSKTSADERGDHSSSGQGEERHPGQQPNPHDQQGEPNGPPITERRGPGEPAGLAVPVYAFELQERQSQPEPDGEIREDGELVGVDQQAQRRVCEARDLPRVERPSVPAIGVKER